MSRKSCELYEKQESRETGIEADGLGDIIGI